jgi:16S rRNA (cytidine1402-2'-O)-methyltransferase
MPGTLFVVATPIGNLEDITARALRVLREASIIAAEDTRRTAHLLARYAIGTPSTSLHEHNERQKIGPLVERLRRGEHVALVSDAGTPTVSDPGTRLIQACVAAGIRVEPIPGPSAAVAALSVSGFRTDTFHFLGFPPARASDRTKWLTWLATLDGTAVFFEAPHRIKKTLAAILDAIGDREVVIGRELTKAHEELVRGPISTALGRVEDPIGEFTVVIDLGRKTKIEPAEMPGDRDVYLEFGLLTKNGALTRRAAVTALALRLRRSSKEIYAAVERGKILVE